MTVDDRLRVQGVQNGHFCPVLGALPVSSRVGGTRDSLSEMRSRVHGLSLESQAKVVHTTSRSELRGMVGPTLFFYGQQIIISTRSPNSNIEHDDNDQE